MSASTLDADTILPTILITDAQVYAVQRLSPAFVRVDIGSPRFADIARDEGFDTRIKLIFPGPRWRVAGDPRGPRAVVCRVAGDARGRA
jgi:NADPH-dependent ferric siderophore reductase